MRTNKNYFMGFGKDKVLHFSAGALMAMGVYLIALVAYFISPNLMDYSVYPAVFAGGLAVVVGAAKEIIWDRLMGRGTFEVGDFVMTAMGGFLTIFVVELIRLI